MKYIISNEYRFIYFVTQKVACTSLKIALSPYFPIDIESYKFINRFGEEKYRIHKAFDESGFQYDKTEMLEKVGKYRNHFKFGFVRNPWDRLVSCFTQKLHKDKKVEREDKCPLRPPFGDKTVFYLGMPFQEFIESIHAIPDSESDAHFRAQFEVFYVDSSASRCMADFVGKFENLPGDFLSINEKITSHKLLELPHELKSRTRDGRDYHSYYTPQTRRLVAERYAEDVDLFQYSF